MHTAIAASRVDPPWWRVALGFLIAPSVGALAGALLDPSSAVGDPAHLGGTFLLYAAGGYLLALLVGLPAYLIARKFTQPTFLATSLAGVLVVFLPVMVLHLSWAAIVLLTGGDLPDPFAGLPMAAVALCPPGAVAGAMFWLIVFSGT